MRSLHIIAIFVAAVGLLVSIALLVAVGLRRAPGPAPAVPDQGLAGLRIPEFALIDHNGQSQTHALLDDHITIIDFIFTNCPLACPGMTSRMADMQDALAATGVRFASFSLDPERDTPEVLLQYARHVDADLANWTFLTGDRQTIWSIVQDSLKFELAEQPESPITLKDGTTMPNILHPIRFLLIGPERQVLGMYSFSDPEQMTALESRARQLAAR